MSANNVSQTLISFPYDDLFDWYDLHGRDLPWRYRWPELVPIYHLWLSEIMLQQTLVKTVIPYFFNFIERWPTIDALAAATLDEVLAAWAGLGYYARARNLHKTANLITNEYGGSFPNTKKELLALPGIGFYTAGAIMVIGFGQPGVVVDSNIERIMSRFYSIQTVLPTAKAEICAAYEHSRPNTRPSDFPQALMDFANSVCTSKSPSCTICPLSRFCRGYADNIVSKLPNKIPKIVKPTRLGMVFVAINQHGEVLLERRPEMGLLGGMMAFPSSGWEKSNQPKKILLKPEEAAPFPADWQQLYTPLRHVFTHFILEMTIYIAHVTNPAISLDTGVWQHPQPTKLPSLMRKVWKLVKTSNVAITVKKIS